MIEPFVGLGIVVQRTKVRSSPSHPVHISPTLYMCQDDLWFARFSFFSESLTFV